MTHKIIYESAETETRRNIKLGYIIGALFIVWGIVILFKMASYGRLLIFVGLFFMFCSFIAKLIQKL